MTDSCITKVKHTTIIFTEAKSRFEIKNPKQREIEKHQVDDCLIKDKTIKKCDWLAIDVLSKREIYIELKGQDADSDAIEQISNSVELLSKDKTAIKLGYIVHTSSRKPEMDTTNQKVIKRLKKSNNLILRIKKTPHTENIEDLIAVI